MKLAIFRRLASFPQQESVLFAVVNAKNFYSGAYAACSNHDMPRPSSIPMSKGNGWMLFGCGDWNIGVRRATDADILPDMNKKAVLIVNASGLTKVSPIPNIYVPCVLTGHKKHVLTADVVHLEIQVGKLTYWVSADAVLTEGDRIEQVYGKEKKRVQVSG